MSLRDLKATVEELASDRFLPEHLENFHRRLCRPRGCLYVDRRLWAAAMRMIMLRELPLALWRDQERSSKFLCGLLASCEVRQLRR